MTDQVRTSVPSPDAIVVGAGIIGLSAGAALANAGMRVTIVGAPRAGEASWAAAGLLAPSVEEVSAAHAFALASRDRYPPYIAWLFERSGLRVPLNRNGVLEVALDEHEQATLATSSRPDGEWLTASQVGAIEPALRHAAGAFLYPEDGAVDNVALLRAIAAVLERDPRVTRLMESVNAVDPRTLSVTTNTSVRLSAATIVLAAGSLDAWNRRASPADSGDPGARANALRECGGGESAGIRSRYLSRAARHRADGHRKHDGACGIRRNHNRRRAIAPPPRGPPAMSPARRKRHVGVVGGVEAGDAGSVADH